MILLTGATGFVGMEVLARLLEDDEGDEIVALVRGADEGDAQARLARVLDGLGVARDRRERVRAVRGELTAPLPPVGTVDTVVHCAASVSFGLPLTEARAINVGGTRRLLGVEPRRFVHVSTAYVAGRHVGRFGEDDLLLGQEYRNTYEQTKAEAEVLVREAAMPSVIVRPSIVMGESDTGWTNAFNVLYWPLRAFSRGLLPVVPADPAAHVDVVPVDYVADTIVHALRDERVNGTIAAVAGDGAATAGELIELACRAFARPRPVVEPLDRGLAELSDEGARYLPYFDVRAVFDTTRARAAGVPPAPPLASYFDRIVAFAQQARWGKRPITRAQARAEPEVQAA